MLQAIRYDGGSPAIATAAALPGIGIYGNGLGGAGLGNVQTGLTIFSWLATASMAASAYHGYKRNDSIGWAVGWAILGGIFPIITPAIALAQGFGKRKR